MSRVSKPSMLQNPAEQAGAQIRAQAQEAAQQARDAAQQARDLAQQARDAAQAQRDEAQAGPEGGNTGVITIQKNGQTITLDGASPEAVMSALGMPVPDQQGATDGPFVVAGIGIVATAIVLVFGLLLRYRAITRGVSKKAELPAELTQRMARMETAIESVAIEVERISEGQRFTTRLLSDRAPLEVPRG